MKTGITVILFQFILTSTFCQSHSKKEYPNFTHFIYEIADNERIYLSQVSNDYNKDSIKGRGASHLVGSWCGSVGHYEFDESGDTAQIITSVSYSKIKIRYITKKDSISSKGCYYSYFQIGSQKFETDTFFNQCESRLESFALVGSIGNSKIICLKSRRLDSNRNGVGPEVKHLFINSDSLWTLYSFEDISLVSESHMFCDINKDEILDYLKITKDNIEGQSKPASDSENTYFNVIIMTKKGKNWEQLTDKKGKTYYILVKGNKLKYPDKFEIIEYNWPKKI